jgi:hypothetical protein
MPFMMLYFDGFFSAKSYLVVIADIEGAGIAAILLAPAE